MSASEHVKLLSLSLELPNSIDKSVSQMLQDSSIVLEKSCINGLLLPQFPSLLGDYHMRQPGPLNNPRALISLSSGFIPNDCSISPPVDSNCLLNESLVCTVDTRVVDYRFDSPCKKPQHSAMRPGTIEVSMSSSPKKTRESTDTVTSGSRLNKFVRRLYDMLCGEKNSGIVQWRRGLLILLDTKLFAKHILPKYFNTRNFKTFRRQLNYYGFVHVRSYSNTGTKSTTALWVNQELATGNVDGQKNCNELDSVTSVLHLKRVEPCDSAKTSEGRRFRKELAMSTIEDDLGVSPQSIQLRQLCALSDKHPKIDSKDMSGTNLFHRQDELSFVQHHNWSPIAVASSPVCVSRDVSSTKDSGDQRNLTPSPRNSCRFDSSNSDDNCSKPPTSSTSVANLLLLLSSG